MIAETPTATGRTSSWPAPTSTPSPRARDQRQRLGLGNAGRARAADLAVLRRAPRTRCASAGGAPRRRACSARPSTSPDSAKKELAKIALYLNFDMIGSPNFGRLIYDGDGSAFDIPGPKGSDKIEKTFAKYFKRRGPRRPRRPSSMDAPTISRSSTPGSRPAACSPAPRRSRPTKQQKLFGGKAGVALDACYHQACDDVDNVSRKAIKQMAPAVADAVARYAISTDSLKGGGKGGKKRAASALERLRGRAPAPLSSAHARGVAQFGSAFDWGSKGRWFKSSRPDRTGMGMAARSLIDRGLLLDSFFGGGLIERL